jgi:hypothetical protein
LTPIIACLIERFLYDICKTIDVLDAGDIGKKAQVLTSPIFMGLSQFIFNNE